MRATAAEETQSGGLVLLCLASWAIPGAGHLWLGRRTKGLIFLVALPLMFAIGLALHGRLFPFDLRRSARRASRPSPTSASARRTSSRSARPTARGDVRAVTYEYGNAFLIVAGLLNLLVVIDAYDIAMGPEVMQSHLLLLVALRVLRVARLRGDRERRRRASSSRFGGMMFGGFLLSAARARLADVSVPL